MPDLLYALVLVVVLGALTIFARRRRRAGRDAAKTVQLSIDASGVERSLADGRSEAVRWDELHEIQVIRTTVPTPDGAREFAVLAGAGDVGCFVPLGIGHDTLLLAQLARLDGFELHRFSTARRGGGMARAVVWRSPAQPAPDVVADRADR